MQDFALCLRVPSKFLLVIGYCCSWAPSKSHGNYQTPLPGTICLELTIWVGVCWQPRLKWIVPQERHSTAGQMCLTYRIPLTILIPPLWHSFHFIVRRIQRYMPCYKMHIGNMNEIRPQPPPQVISFWTSPFKPPKNA